MSEVRVELQRQGYTEFGTLGGWVVYDGSEAIFTCLSAENPDRDNEPRVSCIPEGEYKLVRARYHRGGYPCFQIFAKDGGEIPGRTQVKVHVGNTMEDVLGCVVLGNGPIANKGCWGVGRSGGPNGAFTKFMKIMDELDVDECPLSIFYRKG
jgi:hypothetical protein